MANNAQTLSIKPETILARAKAIGKDIVDLQISAVKTFSLTETLQTKANEMRTEGVKLGKSVKTCTWRQGIYDSIIALCPEKTAQKTCMNYVTSFVKAVNDGTPFSLSDSKGKSKAKGTTEKDTSIFPLLAKLFSHEDFKTTMTEIEEAFQNDEGSVYDIIQSKLEEQGYEIKE